MSSVPEQVGPCVCGARRGGIPSIHPLTMPQTIEKTRGALMIQVEPAVSGYSVLLITAIACTQSDGENEGSA